MYQFSLGAARVFSSFALRLTKQVNQPIFNTVKYFLSEMYCY